MLLFITPLLTTNYSTQDIFKFLFFFCAGFYYIGSIRLRILNKILAFNKIVRIPSNNGHVQ